MNRIFSGAILSAIAAMMLLAFPNPALAAEEEAADHPEARLYNSAIDATDAVNAAMARASKRQVNALIVLGANWCHDSRAFAGWTETDRIGALIASNFELVFVNMGMPQTGDGHNMHILRRFRFDSMEGTPMVLVVTPDGAVLNRDTAKNWRNTASRSEDDIFDELESFALASGENP